MVMVVTCWTSSFSAAARCASANSVSCCTNASVLVSVVVDMFRGPPRAVDDGVDVRSCDQVSASERLLSRAIVSDAFLLAGLHL